MVTYSIAEAAKHLGVTRQTVYKHANRDKERCIVNIDGKQRVTMYGMELLKKITAKSVKTEPSAAVSTPVDYTLVRQLQEQITTLEKTVSDLQAQLNEARIKLAKAEGYIQAKDEDYNKALSTLVRPGGFTAWLRNRFPGKAKE